MSAQSSRLILVLYLLLEASQSFVLRPISITVLQGKSQTTKVTRQAPPPPPRNALLNPNNHNRRMDDDDDNKDDAKDEDEELRYKEWQRKQTEIERKVRLQIQVDDEKARIRRETTFDVAAEMLKVESISQGLPLDSHERLVDDQISKLEGELYAAVDKFDLSKAQKMSEEISQIHIDDCGAVLQVNSAFYRAFTEKDYNAMEKLWLHDASILCIHPSHAPLVGAPAVLESWKAMFESTVGSFQRNWMEPCNIKLVVKGTTAIITCDEEVYARRFVRGAKRETELMNKLTATNIYRKVNSKWYMVHHHASWHADSEISKMALNGGMKPSKNKNNSNNKDGSKITFNPAGILGTKEFGPFLGNPDKSEKPTVKKIILGGSLSDILNGNLGDFISASSDDDEDAEDDGDDTAAIIKITNIDEEDEDDHDDDDDEDDDDVEDVDEEISSFVKELHLIREKNKSSRSKQKKLSNGSSNNKADSPQDSVRQSCISALRKLANQGLISQKQKRVLLTDIISCSARGEYSMVEVAYELLCGENGHDNGGTDSNVAEEEFADQCRVFFDSLSV